jgi:hypothetical protein
MCYATYAVSRQDILCLCLCLRLRYSHSHAHAYARTRLHYTRIQTNIYSTIPFRGRREWCEQYVTKQRERFPTPLHTPGRFGSAASQRNAALAPHPFGFQIRIRSSNS